MATEEELLLLIETEIPEGRKCLQENYLNLENVARYCEDNYRKASVSEKSLALDETKNYTNHSLASVAYQINSLATNFVKLLDLQLTQLTDMESSVNHLNQIVKIHKEKVARREIGILTVGKKVPKSLGMKNGIIYPEQTERAIRYSRKSVDFTVLDGIGHGLQPKGSTPKVARSPSIYSTSSNISTSQTQAATPSTPAAHPGGPAAAGSHYLTPGPQMIPPPAPSTPKPQETSASTVTVPPVDYDDFPQPSPGFAASPPLPPPPSDDQPEYFNFTEVAPPPLDLHTNRQKPRSIRDSRISGSTPQDTYAATREPDDPYAATGPQFVSQSSNIPLNYIEKVVAIYDYQAMKDDELSFAENAVVYVIHKNDDGWWEGTVDGRTGLFPFNYVEPCM